MRTYILSFIMILAACLASSAENSAKNLPVGAAARLRIECDGVRVIVHGDNHGAVFARFDDAGYSEARLDATTQGGEVLLTASRRRSRLHFNVGDHTPTLEVSAPNDAIVVVHSKDGSIRLNNLHADATLDSSDGSIHVSDYAGRLRMRSRDGSLHLSSASGDFELETGDGSINIDDVRGGVRASSRDGSLRARGAFTDLQLHANDGSIRLELLDGSQMKGDWQAHTQDGSIRVLLPRSLAVRVDASTGDGRVYDNGAVQPRGRSLLLTLNNGSHTLDVRSRDGSVRVDH